LKDLGLLIPEVNKYKLNKLIRENLESYLLYRYREAITKAINREKAKTDDPEYSEKLISDMENTLKSLKISDFDREILCEANLGNISNLADLILKSLNEDGVKNPEITEKISKLTSGSNLFSKETEAKIEMMEERFAKNFAPISSYEGFNITYNPKYLNGMMKIISGLDTKYLKSLVKNLTSKKLSITEVFNVNLFINYVSHYILNYIRNMYLRKLNEQEFHEIYGGEQIIDDDRLKDVELTPIAYGYVSGFSNLIDFGNLGSGLLERFVLYSTLLRYK
jgi:hypothetical protein